MGVILITGCSSGIGLAATLAFARRGDTVVATMRNLDKSTELREQLTGTGLDADIRRLDVSDDGLVHQTVTEVIDQYGTIDVVVNNAGVANRGPVETQSLEKAAVLMDTNFWGPIRVTRAVLPVMRGQRSGVIINVGSLAGRLPGTPYSGMYAASKHALATISEALASEVSPFGIRVVSIEPGFFATEIAENNLSAGEEASPVYAADQAWLAAYFEQSVETGGRPEAVADAIVAAAYDTRTRLHTPVGDDAMLMLALLDDVDGYEGWQDVAIPIVEAVAGPRPEPG